MNIKNGPMWLKTYRGLGFRHQDFSTMYRTRYPQISKCKMRKATLVSGGCLYYGDQLVHLERMGIGNGSSLSGCFFNTSY